MTSLATTEAFRDPAALLRKVRRGKRLMLCDARGKNVAAIVPPEDLALMERLIEEEEDRIDAELCRKAKREFEESGEQPIAWETIKAEWDAEKERMTFSPKSSHWEPLFRSLNMFSEDFMQERSQPAGQEREDF
jgi:antitoxin (DNA-binding transcriptional repressor) of toxin-antitoxin stability system